MFAQISIINSKRNVINFDVCCMRKFIEMHKCRERGKMQRQKCDNTWNYHSKCSGLSKKLTWFFFWNTFQILHLALIYLAVEALRWQKYENELANCQFQFDIPSNEWIVHPGDNNQFHWRFFPRSEAALWISSNCIHIIKWAVLKRSLNCKCRTKEKTVMKKYESNALKLAECFVHTYWIICRQQGPKVENATLFPFNNKLCIFSGRFSRGSLISNHSIINNEQWMKQCPETTTTNKCANSFNHCGYSLLTFSPFQLNRLPHTHTHTPSCTEKNVQQKQKKNLA